jgi:hypothetical protein
MKFKRFVPEKHTTELVKPEVFITGHPLNEGNILRNKRILHYHVNENPDRSFIEAQAAVKIGRCWFIWPQGFQQWVAYQAEKTLQNFAA